MATSFGTAIVRARERLGLKQRDLAAQIVLENGRPMSPQYLSGIERDRHDLLSNHLIEQFSTVLDLPAEYLYFLVGRLPPDVRRMPVDETQAVAAYNALRAVLQPSPGLVVAEDAGERRG